MSLVGHALVTGSNGFVGRHFVSELLERGWKATPCDLGVIDVLDLFREDTHRYDLVVHAAAQDPHRAAIDNSPAGHVYNQLLDAAMFDWAVRTGQGRVLYLSSSAVYPVAFQKGYKPYRLVEGDAGLSQLLKTAHHRATPLYPDAGYGRTKLAGEGLVESVRMAGVPVTVVRPFSGYGEDQGKDWPFGAFVARAKERVDPFPVWNSNAVRDWIHVEDLVKAALAIVARGTEEAVNLCTGIGTSMRDLIFRMTDVMGYRPRGLEYQDHKPQGVGYRVGDPSLMLQYYTPQVSLDEGIKRALGGP